MDRVVIESSKSAYFSWQNSGGDSLIYGHVRHSGTLSDF